MLSELQRYHKHNAYGEGRLKKYSPSLLRELKILFYILKAVGFFPVFKQINANQIEGPTKNQKIYSSTVRGLLYFSTIFNLYSIYHQSSVRDFAAERETDNINQYIEIIISIATYTGTTILCSKYSNDLLNILKDILRIDLNIEQRHQVRIRNNCKFAKLIIFGIIVVQISLISFKFFGGGVSSVIQNLIVFVFAFQNFICSVFIMFLAAMLRVLFVRFEFVNKILDQYTYSVVLMKSGRRIFEEDVSFVFRLHSKLLEILKSLNESCSLIVALFMGYAFYSITTNSYNVFVEFTAGSYVSWMFLLDCFAWLGLNTCLLVILAKECGQTTNMANHLSQVVAKIYENNKDRQIIVDKFLTKSIRQEVEFTAYGFFVVDTSTLFSIFSAVTTYLVILIQFKQLEETKLEE